jgi:hypothetical protein
MLLIPSARLIADANGSARPRCGDAQPGHVDFFALKGGGSFSLFVVSGSASSLRLQ